MGSDTISMVSDPIYAFTLMATPMAPMTQVVLDTERSLAANSK